MNPGEFPQLFEAYFEGTLGEAEARRLAEALRADETLRAQFLHELKLCNMLAYVTDDWDDTEDFIRSFWERVRAEETADQFAHDFEKRQKRETEASHGIRPQRLVDAIDLDERAAAERARQEAETQKEGIRKAAEKAFAQFLAEERQRQEELAYKLYRARRRRMIVGVSSLAVILVIVLGAWLSGLKSEGHRQDEPTAIVPQPVATITKASGVRWNRVNVTPAPGTRLPPGSVRFSTGFVEMTFDKGARVIVEAPAEVDLIDQYRVHLNAGVLTAHVPEAARGFEVDTPSVRVTDLGTEFGLVVEPTGAVDVHTLDGCVATSLTPIQGDKREHVKLLHRDEAMRFDARAGTTHDIAVDADRFARSWDDVLYKPCLGGFAKFLYSMPVSLAPGAFESNDHIHVFLERTDVVLSHDVTVNIVTPGYYKVFRERSGTIPTGSKVDSYLIHWNPIGENGIWRKVSGSVTFRRPILGLIAGADRFVASDVWFCHDGTAYPRVDNEARGLEDLIKGPNGGDTILFSQDRLAVTVTLSSSAVDELRILVTAATDDER